MVDASGTASASRAPVHGAGTTKPRAQQAPRPVRLLQPGRWAPWPLAPPAPAVPPPAPRPLGSRWTSPSLGFLTNSTTGGRGACFAGLSRGASGTRSGRHLLRANVRSPLVFSFLPEMGAPEPSAGNASIPQGRGLRQGASHHLHLTDKGTRHRDVGKSPEATQPLSPTLGSVSSRRLAALGHRQA